MARKDPGDLRRRLYRLAAEQAGYFTAAQAIEVGYSHQSQKYHADRGDWRRVSRGLYRLPEWPVGPTDDLVRWAVWSGNQAVVSHDTALSAHDLGDFDPGGVHLTVPPGFSKRPPAGLVLHRAEVPDTDTRAADGYRITTPLRTLVDVAAQPGTQLDLLTGAVREALRRGVVTERALRDRADQDGPQAALNIERALQAAAV
jgi:predicted transcriptional regulator of viral defense system